MNAFGSDMPKLIYCDRMNAIALGIELAKRRRAAGLTQAQVATRMGTTQAAISRIESGRTLPSIGVLDRFALAIGQTFSIEVGATPKVGRKEKRQRVRRALGGYAFDPWKRNPTDAEARSLLRDGLTRERFQSARTP
jgi:transcriptional regulator with XRE-family HTH domain